MQGLQSERDLRLDALCDLALGASLPAIIFSAVARSLGVPFAGPLTMVGLLLGMVPVVGRAVWLSLVALLAVLDTSGRSAVAVVVLVVGVTLLSEQAARRAVRRWSGGRHAHRVRALLAVAGVVVAGLAGLVVGLAVSPRRRAVRTRRRERWLVGAWVSPILLATAAAPAVLSPAQGASHGLPDADPVVRLPVQTKAVVLFVHGLGEASGRRGDFDELFDPLRASFGDVVHDAFYYQDLRDRRRDSDECDAAGPTLTAPRVPPDVAGMPIARTSQSRDKCDSESDLGLNVLTLAEQVEQLHRSTGKRVVLVGYSMGGAIVRGLITLSAVRHDGLVERDVDSVVLLHAVSQGSVLARDGGRVADIPWLGPLASRLAAGTIADTSRPAFSQLAPRSPFNRWLAQHAPEVPALPTFVTYGDITVAGKSCVLGAYVCLTTGRSRIGDGAVDPGSPRPTDLPVKGGARYLPQGKGPQSWEWPERVTLDWDRQLDALSLQLISRVYHASAEHFAVLSSSDQIVVADCQTGEPVRESDELRRIVSGRLIGLPYECRTTGTAN